MFKNSPGRDGQRAKSRCNIYEKLKIKIKEQKANTKLIISMRMELPWCKGEEYSSYGVFHSDEKGEVDLDLAKPIEGTYESNDSMGVHTKRCVINLWTTALGSARVRRRVRKG